MNKQEFLKKLKHELRNLKKEERNKYVEYYDEIISDIMEHGISEEEAIAKQGGIEKIVGDILANTNPENLKNRDWRGFALLAGTIVLLMSSIISLILKIQFKANMSTAVGVIGGADGPTSIFIAGRMGTPWGLYIATAVVVIVTIIYFVKKHRKDI